MNWGKFLLFIVIGFAAQIIDGTLGMAYGVSCRTFLKTVAGVPSALASAVVHVAEVPTTLASGLSHIKLKNVDKSLFFHLAIPGVIGGVAGAAWLWALAQVAPQALQPSDPASAVPLVVKLLYGGITEELLVRWGVMTLLLWLGWRVVQRGKGLPGKALVAVAVLLSALLFAVGHLPAAQAMAGVLTPPVVLFVLVGNTAFGLLAGALFARRGLEAAIVAHVLAHLLSHPLL